MTTNVKHNIDPSIEHLAHPVEGLRPFPDNARMGDTDKIGVSLLKNKQYRPIVVNTREGTRYGDGCVLAGNHTYFAAMELGWTHVAVTFVDADDKRARNINLVDNKASDDARYDEAVLARLVEEAQREDEFGDLSATGFTQEELQDLRAAMDEPMDLDDLAEEYGEPTEDEFWPQIKVRVPQDAFDHFHSLMGQSSETVEGKKFAAVLAAVRASDIR